MAVAEVFLAFADPYLDEENVGAMALHQIGAVLPVFVAVPVVVIASVEIVVIGFTMSNGISSCDPTRSRATDHHKCHLWNSRTYAARSALVVAWAAIASPIRPRRSSAQA